MYVPLHHDDSGGSVSQLERTILGRTGLEVTKLGYGAMELRGGARGRDLDEDTVGTLLNAVLDAGINYIDTSPDYGLSEERIGRHISSRRGEFFLASKCGCPVGDASTREHVFTPENIRAAVEQSLARMKTDYVDVVQFHISPSKETLLQNGAVEALAALRDEGKVRFLGMSGTLPNITDHIAMGVFDVFQIPYSAIEREHEQAIADANAAGAGIVVRGGVARGVPVAPQERIESMTGPFREALARRKAKFEEAKVDDLLDGMSRMEFMLRFTLSHPGMHTTIVGTANVAHLQDNLAAAAKGALPSELYELAKKRLSA